MSKFYRISDTGIRIRHIPSGRGFDFEDWGYKILKVAEGGV
jgi:hypothetical protein